MLTLTMPWPALKELSPNWRGHWAARAKAKKTFRQVWWAEALHQGAGKLNAEKLHVSLCFHMPDKRARDLDNLLASCKAGLDGLADAIGVDDSKWSLEISKAETIGGFVRVIVQD